MDNNNQKKRALGKGLEQLFSNERLDFDQMEHKIVNETDDKDIKDIPLSEIRSNPYQPRKSFDEQALNELASSIKEHGVVQPIIVKKSIKGYEIIAGERRFRASRLAGKDKIPAIVRNFSDEQMMEIALLENLQRENLSAIEEAVAYKVMLEKLNMTQEDLAKKVGKSRSHITNTLGLLRLPFEVQQMIIRQDISMSHARVISKLESQEEMIKLANKILAENLPVHEVERISNDDNVIKKVKNERKKKSTSSEYKYVEDLASEKLDTKVRIKDKKIEISFNNINDLNRILEILDIKE